jgi:hypothetical protein
MARRKNGVYNHNAEKCQVVGYSAILGEIITTSCNRNPSVRATWYSALGGERTVRVRGKDQKANLDAALDT